MARVCTLFLTLFLLSGCADSVDPASVQNLEPVGFWYGLWHGLILAVAFIVSLFDDTVAVYAVYNSGGWYDFGFLIGVMMVFGGGTHVKKKSEMQKRREKEWHDIGTKVEAKVMRNLKAWADDEQGPKEGDDWQEIAQKAEAKLKRKIREWAESE